MTDGKTFEKYIYSRIKSHGYLCLNDVIVGEHEYSQIDVLVFLNSCIYVLECKDYNCLVSGESDSRLWCLSYRDRTFLALNPFIQNRAHCRRVANIASCDRVFNAVIFSENAVYDKKQGIMSIRDFLKILDKVGASKVNKVDVENYKIFEKEKIKNMLLENKVRENVRRKRGY